MSEFLHKLFTIILTKITDIRASTVAQTIKNLPEMQETWVRSLIWEEPLKKGMATHSSILAEKIPWTEEPGGATIHGVTESDLTERLTFFFFT